MADAPYDSTKTVPLIAPGHTSKPIGDKIAGIVLTPHTPLAWFITTFLAFMGVMMLTVSLVWLLPR